MPRILIADDSRFARMVIAAIVEEHFPDWEVVQASDGDEALEKLLTETFDFATLDMNMPGRDGITVKQEVDKQRDGVPAALVTANVQDQVRKRAAAHFVAFLEKPVQEDELHALLTQHVGSAQH